MAGQAAGLGASEAVCFRHTTNEQQRPVACPARALRVTP